MKKFCLVLGIILILTICAGCDESNILFKNGPGVMIDVPLNQQRADNQVEIDEERNYDDLSVALESAENSDEITNSIILSDIEFIFPCDLDVLLMNNWSLVEDEETKVSPQKDKKVILENNDSTIEVVVFNNSNETRLLKDCLVTGILCNLENNVSASLTNSIKLGDNVDEVKESSAIFKDVQFEENNSCTFDRSEKVFINGLDEKIDYELTLSWNDDNIISEIEMIVNIGA